MSIPTLTFSDEFEHVLNQQPEFDKLDAEAQYEWLKTTPDKSILTIYVDRDDVYAEYDADNFSNFKLYFKKHIGTDQSKVEKTLEEIGVRYEVYL